MWPLLALKEFLLKACGCHFAKYGKNGCLSRFFLCHSLLNAKRACWIKFKWPHSCCILRLKWQERPILVPLLSAVTIESIYSSTQLNLLYSHIMWYQLFLSSLHPTHLSIALSIYSKYVEWPSRIFQGHFFHSSQVKSNMHMSNRDVNFAVYISVRQRAFIPTVLSLHADRQLLKLFPRSFMPRLSIDAERFWY